MAYDFKNSVKFQNENENFFKKTNIQCRSQKNYEQFL